VTIYRFPVKLAWGGAGSPGVNVWHIRTVDPSVPGLDLGSAQGQLDDASEAIRTFYDTIKTHLAPGASVGSPDLVTTVGDAEPQFDQVTTPWGMSSGASGAAPAPVALTCTWYTENATRRGRGRTFISPLADNTLSANGTPNDAVIATFHGAAQALVNASKGANGWAIGVWSEVDQVLRDVTRTKVRDTFAVLRSRRD
jgi:hypothetical protein